MSFTDDMLSFWDHVSPEKINNRLSAKKYLYECLQHFKKIPKISNIHRRLKMESLNFPLGNAVLQKNIFLNIFFFLKSSLFFLWGLSELVYVKWDLNHYQVSKQTLPLKLERSFSYTKEISLSLSRCWWGSNMFSHLGHNSQLRNCEQMYMCTHTRTYTHAHTHAHVCSLKSTKALCTTACCVLSWMCWRTLPLELRQGSACWDYITSTV